MGRKRDLTPEEKRLWRHVTREDKRLHDEPHSEEDDEAVIPEPEAKPEARPAEKKPAAAKPSARLPDLALGSYAGVDTRTAEKFRRGQYPIDATLDLHGFSQKEAQAELEAFLRRQYDRGSRCLLAITGKGRRGEKGVLRHALPGWMASEDLRRLVLAFDVAKARHGGEGAYYILLKRKR